MGFAGEIAQADELVRARRMAKRQPDPIGRDLDRLCMQRLRAAAGRQDNDGDIEFAPDQQMLQIVRRVLDRLDRDIREGTAEAGEQVGIDIAGDQWRDADREPP